MESKFCKDCQTEKSASEFFYDSHRKDRLSFYCKACVKIRTSRYLATPEGFANHKRLTKRWQAGQLAFIRSHKAKPCMDCGVQYPYYVMTFDHIPERGKKLINLGHGGTAYNRKMLEDEISKCDVVCFNCHHEREHQRRQGNSHIYAINIKAAA